MKRIPVANPRIGEDEAKAVYNVVKSGWITMGAKVKEFETLACTYTGAKFAIAMNNGTSTLHAILMALKIGPGDEVIIPSLSYISAANVILYQGATPILCDSDPITFNTTPELVKQKITNKTKAFMTVDMKGLPVDYSGFQVLADETGLPFIADSAESYGSIYKGSSVGTQAFAHSFSFFANKNITTGEGGMVTTNSEDLYEKLIIIRNQGQEGRYNHTWLGNNFRMTDILAAFGVEQLKKIDEVLNDKVFLAHRYDKSFSDFEEVDTPTVPKYVDRPSWYLYSITVNSRLRDEIIKYLEQANIETRVSFPPIHRQPYFINQFNFKSRDFPLAEKAFKSFIDIPIWAGMNSETQYYIIDTIKNFFKRN